jgi:hypothetical protein
MGPIEVIPEMLIPISFFALVFGIVYIRNRENMALIDRGINPRITDARPRHFVSLKWGLLLAGAGLGLLMAFFIDYNIAPKAMVAGKYNGPAVYFSMIAIGGGIGLICSYFIEKKEWDKKDRQQ